MSRRVASSLALGATLAAFGLVAGRESSAAAHPPASVTLAPASGPAGAKVKLKGRALPPAIPVRIHRPGGRDRVVRTERSGSFATKLRIRKRRGTARLRTTFNGKAILNRYRIRPQQATGPTEIATTGGARFRITPGRPDAGTSLTVDGAGLARRSSVVLRLRGTGSGPVRLRADQRGRASHDFLIPPETGRKRFVLLIATKRLRLRHRIKISQPLVVAAAGDIACDPASASFNGGAGTARACRQMATSQLALDARPDVVLPLGDTQYETGALSDFWVSYDPSWGRLLSISRPVVGNHEYLTPGATGYFDYFNGPEKPTGRAGERDKGYYSFDRRNWHFVALNTMCSRVGCAVGGAQERWLREDLRRNTHPCVLAYGHHPRFSSGEHGSTASVAPLFDALYDARAELYLAGHDHIFERYAPQRPDGAFDPKRGVRQFISGLGGKNWTSIAAVQPNSEVRATSSFGVLILWLGRGTYRWAFQTIDGATIDSGAATCG